MSFVISNQHCQITNGPEAKVVTNLPSGPRRQRSSLGAKVFKGKGKSTMLHKTA